MAYLEGEESELNVEDIRGIWVASDDSEVVERIKAIAPSYLPNVSNNTIFWAAGGVEGGPKISQTATRTDKEVGGGQGRIESQERRKPIGPPTHVPNPNVVLVSLYGWARGTPEGSATSARASARCTTFFLQRSALAKRVFLRQWRNFCGSKPLPQSFLEAKRWSRALACSRWETVFTTRSWYGCCFLCLAQERVAIVDSLQ